MIRILVIIPYAALRKQFEDRITQERTSEIHIDTTHLCGDPPRNLVDHCEYDIIVSRGITYWALRKELPKVHFIEISITGFDVIAAIAAARTRYKAGRIAVFMNGASLNPMDDLAELCGIPIDPYEVRDEHEVEDSILRAKERGAEVFVGGLTLCRRCHRLGYRHVHIKSGASAVDGAVTQAVQTARSLLQERAKTKLAQSILNNSRDAIISLDEAGRVTGINNRAIRDLNIPLDQDPVGAPIGSYYAFDQDWRPCVSDGIEGDTLRLIGGASFLINSKPIQVDGRCTGVLITMQNTEKISEAESKVRKEIANKGLIAKHHFDSIIGSSPELRNCVTKARKFSAVNSNVLITGETGTGKELFAQSIHNGSPRKQEPFVAVNCAALPEYLLDSELFGYVDGSFTGAIKGGKAGLFELAHRGTIFLDEIGEMPYNLQAKLLRVLQEREIRRLGDNKILPIDVRVISATNIDIQRKIEGGEFRPDLFYRLNLLHLPLPPLRERPGDILEMARSFISRIAVEYGKKCPLLGEDAARILSDYPWPGNVRELYNVCERLVIVNEGASIDSSELEQINFSSPAERPEELSLQRVVDQLNQPRITKEEMARMLGVSRTTLWRRTSQQGRTQVR